MNLIEEWLTMLIVGPAAMAATCFAGGGFTALMGLPVSDRWVSPGSVTLGMVVFDVCPSNVCDRVNLFRWSPWTTTTAK